MINVLDLIKKDKDKKYDDEKYFSTLRVASFCHALRSIENSDQDRNKLFEDNLWICEKANTIGAILLDNVKKEVDSNINSIDAFLYHVTEQNKLNFLVEFKKTTKRNVLKMLDSNNDDSIYKKYQNCEVLIKNELRFGGCLESLELINNTHAVIVYDGKNDVANSNGPKLPHGSNVQRDMNGKQQKASRYKSESKKIYEDAIDRFGNKIAKLHFASCEDNYFSIPALPKAKKEKGKSKVRLVSIFSASDFSTLISNGDFDNWDWDKYST